MNAYQYIFINNQPLCYNQYFLTPKHYSSEKACLKDWHRGGEGEIMFYLVSKFKPSRITGRMAEIVTSHED